MSEERKWDEEFEDIVESPEQSPIIFVEEEAVDGLGPAIAEGGTLHEAIEAYRREMQDE